MLTQQVNVAILIISEYLDVQVWCFCMIGYPCTGNESSLTLPKRQRFGKALKSFDCKDYKF